METAAVRAIQSVGVGDCSCQGNPGCSMERQHGSAGAALQGASTRAMLIAQAGTTAPLLEQRLPVALTLDHHRSAQLANVPDRLAVRDLRQGRCSQRCALLGSRPLDRHALPPARPSAASHGGAGAPRVPDLEQLHQKTQGKFAEGNAAQPAAHTFQRACCGKSLISSSVSKCLAGCGASALGAPGSPPGSMPGSAPGSAPGTAPGTAPGSAPGGTAAGS